MDLMLSCLADNIAALFVGSPRKPPFFKYYININIYREVILSVVYFLNEFELS